MEKVMRLLCRSLVMLIWVIAAGALAWQFTVPCGVAAAVAGTLAAFAMAKFVARKGLRLPVLWIGAAAAWVVLTSVVSALRGSPQVSVWLGAGGVYAAAECLFWFFSALVWVGALETSSRVSPFFVAIDITAVAAILTGLLSAHRDGLVNRPFFLIDWLWTRGYDPLPVFMAAGAVVAALTIILLALRGSKRASMNGILAGVLLVLLIVAALPAVALKMLPAVTGAGGGDGGKDHAGSSKNSGGKNSSADKGKNQDQNPSFDNQSQNGRQQPVAVVLLHDDYNPPAGYYYFRETAFSQFNGQRLVRDGSGKRDRDSSEFFPSPSIELYPSPQTPGATRVRTTVALLTSHARPFGLVNANRLTAAQNPDPRRFDRAYNVESSAPRADYKSLLGRQLGAPDWDADTWAHYTAMPDDPRYSELARQALDILRPDLAGDRVAQVLAVKVWLEKNGTYSMHSGHGAAADPVADFLFGDRTGHCVYFAHAAVLLFRSLGVPARVGSGYAVDARQRGSGSSLLIRGEDSHAWPEIYVRGLGWVVVDIAPEKSLEPPEQPVDSGLQQMMGDIARNSPLNQENLDPSAEPWWKTLLGWLASRISPFLLAVLAFLYGMKLWRRYAIYFCRERLAARAAYRAMLDKLAEAGHRRRFGETRERFGDSKGGLCPAFAGITNLHLAAALGRKHIARKQAADAYQAAAQQLKTGVPFARRWLGILNPISWLGVK